MKIHIKNNFKKDILLFIIIYFGVHVYYYFSGIVFDYTSLNWYWHFIDLDLLKTNLFQSIYYLHSQPPFFNLFLGVIIKIFPKYYIMIFRLLFFLGGFIVFYGIYKLQLILKINRIIALIISIFFLINPSFILHENWLFYTFPVLVMLVISALLLSNFLLKKTFLSGLLFFLSVAIICGTRSLFHLIYMFLVIIIVAWFSENKKKVIFSALIPLIIIFSIYSKNYIVFGKFSTSTWFGMNFWSMTALNLSKKERIKLIDKGKLTKVSSVVRFAGKLKDYPSELINDKDFKKVPILHNKYKKLGYCNFNNISFIKISDLYLKDALYILTHYPKTYIKSLINAFLNFFKPAYDTDHFKLSEMNKLPLLTKIYDIIFLKIPYDLRKIDYKFLKSERINNLYLFYLILFPLTVFYFIKLIIQKKLDKENNILIIFFLLNILYVIFVGNLFESGENNRFRYLVDPFFFVLLGYIINNLFIKLQRTEKVYS